MIKMKKLLLVLAIGSFAACNNSASTEVKTDSTSVTKVDSTTIKSDSTKKDSSVVKVDTLKKDTVIKK